MDFQTRIMEELEKIKPEGVVLKQTTTTKRNEGTLHGITFFTEEYNGGPTFYLEYLEDMHKNGMSVEEIASHLAEIAKTSLEQMSGKSHDFTEGFSNIDEIKLLLVDEESNKKYLEDKPTMPVEDGYVIVAKICRDELAADVTNDLLDTLGWDKEMMFDVGIDNAMKKIKLTELASAIFGDSKNLWNRIKIDPQPCVLTVMDTQFGASCLFLPGVADSIKKKFGCGFYAIPSSIHEFILMPKSLGANKKTLQAMCKDANANVVEERDVLSSRISEW